MTPSTTEAEIQRLETIAKQKIKRRWYTVYALRILVLVIVLGGWELSARLHWIERTREQLLANDDALTEFLRQHPEADSQEGRTLIRNARKEAQQGKPPRYFRELFQWIKTAAGTPDGDDEAADDAGDDHDDEA